jgi:hypothetical protein
MRAEEMRTLAEDAHDSTVRAMMLRIAADYERLAENADDRAAQDSIMFRMISPDDKASDGVRRLDGAQEIVKCPRCYGARWVCEAHPNEPWGGDHSKRCDGARMPCPDCNEPYEDERPDMDPDFVPAFDRDEGPIH